MILFLFGLATGFLITAIWGTLYLLKKDKEREADMKFLHSRIDALGANMRITEITHPVALTSPPSETTTDNSVTYHPRFGRVHYEKETPIIKKENK